MPQHASGTVTFLFTDIEGSTQRWEALPAQMREELRRHDDLVRAAIEERGGHVFKTTGDGALAAFSGATDALEAALAVQQRVCETLPFSVRIALHSGVAELRDDDYFGPTLNRTARLLAVGHGGQVLVSAASAALVVEGLPAGASLLDLGEHGLRDLTRPERVWQLCHPGLRADFPPLRSLDPARTNLPVQLTSFVGRARDLLRLDSALRTYRTVTLTGAGGVGKTRLALQGAAELLDGFAGGVWLCDLAPVGDAEAMRRAVAASLDVDSGPARSVEDSIIQGIHSRELLFVLDNCEHLLESCARLVDRVMRECPGVKVLATSREALDIDGEYAMRLRSLEVSVSDDLAAIERSEAVQLFFDRALTADPDFAASEADLRVIGRICARLDGIPLAIELAAARVRSMGVREIDALLDERFRLLTGGRRVALERQQTLRATVDWSYALLDDFERTVFVRSSVFAGSFNTAAAIAVTAYDTLSEWEARDALDGLVRKSMITAEIESNVGARYQMLETLRQYARERLDETHGGDVTRGRHAAYYADLATSYTELLLGPDELQWRKPFELELDNVRTAADWAIDIDNADAVVRLIATEAGQQLYMGLVLGDIATRALALADNLDPHDRALVYGAAALEAFGLGDTDRATDLINASWDEAFIEDWPTYAPHLWIAPGIINAGLGRRLLDAVRDHPEQLERTTPNLALRAGVYASLSAYAVMSGDTDLAHGFIERARSLAEESKNPSMIAQALFAYGQVNAHNDPDAALVAFEQSLALADQGAIASGHAAARFESALIYAKQGDYDRARQRLRESVERLSARGRRPELDGAFGYAIEILSTSGDYDGALVLIGAVIDGVLQNLRDMPIPPARTAPDVRGLRELVGQQRFEAALAQGKQMTYQELAIWLVERLTTDS